MRLLMVSNMWPRAARPAFGSFVRSQVESVRSLGVEVEVAVIPGERSATAYLTHIPVIRKAVRHMRPDLVHAHYGLSGWTSSWQSAPLVISFCGDDLLGTIGASGRPSLKSRLAVRLSRAAARRARGIICKSANLAAGLPRAADRERAHVIPNGVDLQRFAPGDQSAARERLGLPPDIPIVLFPHDARARLQKRFALAEAALALVTAELPDAQLLMPNGVPHGE